MFGRLHDRPHERPAALRGLLQRRHYAKPHAVENTCAGVFHRDRRERRSSASCFAGYTRLPHS